jgi:hypothetical protein
MSWPPDVPDFLSKKPSALERLESLSPELINAMTDVEMIHHIHDAALGLAESYQRECQDRSSYGYEDCVLFVAEALVETGAAIDGKLGSQMISKSQQEAKNASQQCFLSDQEQS